MRQLSTKLLRDVAQYRSTRRREPDWRRGLSIFDSCVLKQESEAQDQPYFDEIELAVASGLIDPHTAEGVRDMQHTSFKRAQRDSLLDAAANREKTRQQNERRDADRKQRAWEAGRYDRERIAAENKRKWDERVAASYEAEAECREIERNNEAMQRAWDGNDR